MAAAGLLAIGAYWFLGKPGMMDEPLSDRIAELEKQARTAADTLTGDQMMAIIQKRAQESPKDPEPHKYMGDLLAAVGNPNEAILAYQSALRRDPDYRPAIEALADLLFKLSGRVDPSTRDLYRRAYELDPSDLRIGYFAALGDWQEGKRAEADAEFDRIEALAPEGDQRRQMFKAIRDTFATDKPPEPPPENPPAKPPS